jgi:hypothetical protein
MMFWCLHNLGYTPERMYKSVLLVGEKLVTSDYLTFRTSRDLFLFSVCALEK